MQVDNILNLQGFKLLEILNQQPENKTMFMHGTFDGEEKSVIVIIERLHFPAELEVIESGVKNSTDLVKKEANDIYGFYEARLPENLNGVKLTLVYPATEKHLQKYRRKKYHLINETHDHYRNVTLTYLEESKFSIQWVYNILSHTKEADRIVFEDPNPETGFILLPDAKWDGVTIGSLYLIAIVHKRGIKSLRDLTPDHLPLLENIQKKSKEAVAKKYNIAASQVRIYFHYQPSYYHLHAHVTFLQYSPPGVNVEKSHMIESVIDNIRLVPEYYSRTTLPFVVSEGDSLYRKYQEAGYDGFSKPATEENDGFANGTRGDSATS